MDLHHAEKLVGRTLRSKVPIYGGGPVVPSHSLLLVENIFQASGEISLCCQHPHGVTRLRVSVDEIEEKFTSEYGEPLD